MDDKEVKLVLGICRYTFLAELDHMFDSRHHLKLTISNIP